MAKLYAVPHEAIQWTGDNMDEIKAFVSPQEPKFYPDVPNSEGSFWLNHLIMGDFQVGPGHWITKNPEGDLHAHSDEAFREWFKPFKQTLDAS